MNAVLHALAPFQAAALAPLQNAALALLWYLVTALWMGAVFVALAALLLRLWKPLDAAARYAVWYVALLAVVLGPLGATFAMPLVRVVHLPPSAQTTAPVPGTGVLPAFDPITSAAGAQAPRPLLAVPPLLAYGAAVLWLLVVLAGAARFVAGAFVLAGLKRDALPLSPERRAALPLWQSHAGAAHARAARLCVSDRVEVPVAVGLFDGMVVIPQHVADAFEPGDVDRFVLHELAHLERRDDWTALAQRLAQVVMFFNPAVHVIARRLDLEREIACDDRVVAATSDVRSYAVGLTRMAESTAWPHRALAAPAIFVTRRQLSVRVEQLLTRRRVVAPRVAFAPAAVALAASLGVVGLASAHAPAFALAGAPGAAHPPDRAVVRSRVLIVERHGAKPPDEKRLREEIRALHSADAEQLPALLDALSADAVKHGAVVRTFVHSTATQHR